MPIIQEPFEPTPEDLSQVTHLASLFFSPEDICICMEWGGDILDEFTTAIQARDSYNQLFAAYFRGRLETEIRLRESIRQAAFNGSTPAQSSLIDLFNQSKT